MATSIYLDADTHAAAASGLVLGADSKGRASAWQLRVSRVLPQWGVGRIVG